MKALKLISAFFIFGCIFASTVHAQAVVVKDQTWKLFGCESYDAHEVLTPNGTVNLRINFMLNLTNKYIFKAITHGVYSETIWAVGDNGTVECTGTYYPDGRVMVIGHRKPLLIQK